MMRYYKDDKDGFYVLESDAIEPQATWVQITGSEADTFIHVSVEPTPQDRLNKLDEDNALTQRNLRETVMLMAEAFKTISGGALDLSQIPGVQKVYAVEAEAKALREQL